jgi:Cu(I)/Ag(I) efflux system membrane fusion protein
VRTAAVSEAAMSRTFRAIGRVTYDESALTDVNLRVSGWITKLLVNQTGQRVSRGQTLFTLYSPELRNAQQDFLLATRGLRSGAAPADSPSRMEQLAPAARTRLSLLGLSEAQIDEIAKRGTPLDTIPITSPASGFVIEKDVVEGASIQASTRLFRIAALDKVWVEAEVYEADLAHVRVGQRAKVTLDYLPGQFYDAKVAYVYPYLESAARTGRVRVELANKQHEQAWSSRRTSVLAFRCQRRLWYTRVRGASCSWTSAKAASNRRKFASAVKPTKCMRSSRASRQVTRSRLQACS